MLHAPSHFWSCHFPSMALIITILLYTLFGAPAILLIVPFLIFYPIFLLGTYKKSAISIIVDNDKMFVRQGLDPEKEYALEKVASFTVIRKNFSNMLTLNILEWLFFKPNHPTKMIIIEMDGRELLLFSYLYGSPLKKSWVKFKKQVEDLTNKHVHIKCDREDERRTRGRVGREA
jgi:hypothetical protein